MEKRQNRSIYVIWETMCIWHKKGISWIFFHCLCTDHKIVCSGFSSQLCGDDSFELGNFALLLLFFGRDRIRRHQPRWNPFQIGCHLVVDPILVAHSIVWGWHHFGRGGGWCYRLGQLWLVVVVCGGCHGWQRPGHRLVRCEGSFLQGENDTSISMLINEVIRSWHPRQNTLLHLTRKLLVCINE